MKLNILTISKYIIIYPRNEISEKLGESKEKKQ